MAKLTDAQQAALDRLLAEQQDPNSANYRRWLTPEQYAERFGLSPADLEKLAAWLREQGFTIHYTARGRDWLAFSGTAAQIEAAFHTPIHRYRIGGEVYFSNATDPAVPSTLEPLIAGFHGLNNFSRRIKPHPSYTAPDGGTGLAPDDLTTIYDIKRLSLTGTGEKIAIVGQSDVNLSDIQLFRSTFGLPATTVQLVPYGSPDPGVNDALVEADLDLEWAGASAPGATLIYVYGQSADAAAFYAIDQSLAPIVSESYGNCEPVVSAQGPPSYYRPEAQKANALGITWLASSGDSGAAACDYSASATQGLAVNMPASIPEVTAVGGTEFNEGGGHYWNATNNANYGSALSYIPEVAWNDTASSLANGGDLSAGGGGVSTFYSKPAWQTGIGVPTDGARDVPDLAMNAAVYHDPYIVVTGGNPQLVGGTSASTPVFAGVVALLNQYLKTNGVGNINPTLYRLAQTSGVFHDITSGNNIVPCNSGTPNCVSGKMGYYAGTGYDVVTGLGSVDVYNLVTGWNQTGIAATTTTLSAAPSAISISGSSVLTAVVRAASGSAAPSGTVQFVNGNVTLGTATLAGSGGSATASLTVYGSALAVGSNTIYASYGGGSGFSGSSGSAVVSVSVPTTSSAVVPTVVPNPVYQQPPDSNGYTWFFTVNLSEVAGVSTTLTDFRFNGTSLASQIATFFGSATIPAHGTLSGALGVKNITVPAVVPLVFSGTDASGATWTQQVSVSFYGPQLSAAMLLTSSPGTEIQNPNGDPRCSAGYPYYQQLNLQEQNGYEVQLTKFLAAGNDYTSNIPAWFGSLRLAPLGVLQAGICWKINNAPSTMSFEVDGTDTAGNKIKATASVLFQGPSASAGSLSTSRGSVPMVVLPGQSTTVAVGVTVPSGQAWTVSVLPANQKTSWLVAYPLAGTGPGQVNVVGSGAGLANGVYTAELVFQSVNTTPQFLNVPVTLTIGASSSIAITGVSNGASFASSAAPGMILSVFGSRLANATALATAVPLPLSLGGVSATVNGIAAPLYFVSPGQVNLQLPYETPIGNALLAIDNNGLVATYTFPVKASAPGIFTQSGGSGPLVPTATIAHGGSLAFFITGEGDTSPPLQNGIPPATSLPVNQLPLPLLPLTITVGGVAVTPIFVGIPYGLVGVTQINITVPYNVPLGPQNVVVTVGGMSSQAGVLTVTQ